MILINRDVTNYGLKEKVSQIGLFISLKRLFERGINSGLD